MKDNAKVIDYAVKVAEAYNSLSKETKGAG